MLKFLYLATDNCVGIGCASSNYEAIHCKGQLSAKLFRVKKPYAMVRGVLTCAERFLAAPHPQSLNQCPISRNGAHL